MNGVQPDTRNGSPKSNQFLLFLGVVVLALGVLFHKSFEPNQILFANDGPLAAMKAENSRYPDTFTGHWIDTSWVGAETPSSAPSISGLAATPVSPEFFMKFFAPFGLALLGFSVWLFFRQLKFHPTVCVLGGLAAALNMHFFSVACWGLGTWNVCVASMFFALAALTSPHIRFAWARAVLAGLATGMGVMEGFDVGAILSLYVGMFVFFVIWNPDDTKADKPARSIWMPVVVVLSALLIATHTVSTLVSTQIQGVSAAAQDKATRDRTWNFATQWSVPKLETFRLIIPGVFGYRLEGYIHDTDHSSAYWGRIGEDPNLALLDSSNPEDRRAVSRAMGLRSDYETQLVNPDPQVWTPIANALKAYMQRRHSGSGEYAGILVAVLAIFGLANAFRAAGMPYGPSERRSVWFWSAVALVSLLLAYGRHGFLYRVFYSLPYLSTIRGPMKFLAPFHVAWITLAGYGMDVLARRYLATGPNRTESLVPFVQRWWGKAVGFDKKWAWGSVIALVASMIITLILVSSNTDIERYLENQGFAKTAAQGIASFFFGELLTYIIYLSISLGIVICIVSGGLAGRRAKWAWMAIGVVIALDLGRSDWRWIEYYDFSKRCVTNPVIEFLKDKPYEHRITAELMPLTRQSMASDPKLYGVHFDMIQYLFPCWNIETLDVSQMPREQSFDRAYMNAFRPRGEGDLFPCLRLWQLTNTRYILGSPSNQFNLKFDAQQGFQPRVLFDVVPKPWLSQVTVIEDFTYQQTPNGPFGLYELTNVLPRAKLFANWQTITNDPAALEMLSSRSFDPQKSVIVSEASVPAPGGDVNADPGTVEITQYKSKHVTLKASAKTAAVLLLNDRTDPKWHITVDGKSEPLLRCNYLMRGVYLTKGEHTIEFRFQPPLTTLYVSLSAWGVAILTGAIIIVSNRRQKPAPAPATAKENVKA